jgi:hypothetical protein
MTLRRSIFTFAMLLAPRLALACPVCFGQNDSPLAKAMNLGVLAMLVVVAGVLVSFASFFIYLSRRARLADQLLPAEGSRRSILEGADPQEGTAQC